MNKNYRDIKNDLIHCPFNPNHLVKRSRLITHKKLCPDKNKKGIVQCPYNPSHHILIENLDKHKEKCPDRNIINNDLEKEMIAFLNDFKNGKIKKDIKNVTQKEEDEKENDKNKINEANEIIGLPEKKKNIKNNKKKKEKKEEEKYVDFENITNNDLFNYMFNDKMCIEYDSDSSENDDNCEEHKEDEKEI